jgi:tellurite resistance-related uncharacterized protein
MTTPYRSTPVFYETTLPAALRGRHSTKAGTWGMIRVLEGQVRLTYLEPLSTILLNPNVAGPVAPGQPHFIEPVGPMRMRVDFYNEPPGG